MSPTDRPQKPRLLTALAVASVLTVAISAGAFAAQPEVFHEHWSFTEDDADICGITVDIAGAGVVTERAYFDEGGDLIQFSATFSGTTTFTAASGKSLQLRVSGMSTDELVEITEDTVTVEFTNKGIPELFKTPHGGVLTRDAGVITFRDTFDLATEEQISGEIVVIRGPHPQVDSDFTLFCEVFTDTLG